MIKPIKKNDNRSVDLTFSWLSKAIGTKWLSWEKLAAEWMKMQTMERNEKNQQDKEAKQTPTPKKQQPKSALTISVLLNSKKISNHQ